jgi:hypothetical protein
MTTVTLGTVTSKTWTGAWTSNQTTAAITVSAGQGLLAFLVGNATNTTTNPVGAVTDSASNTWGLLKRFNTSNAGVAGTLEIWWLATPTSGATVSAHAVSGSGPGGALFVVPVSGAAATQNGATAQLAFGGTAVAQQASLTAGTAGDLAVGCLFNFDTNTTWTYLSNSTQLGTFADSTNGDTYSCFAGNVDTTTSPTTWGTSAPTCHGGTILVEVKAGGSTNYTQTATDSAGSVDSLTQIMTASQSPTDLAGSGDTATQVASAIQQATDLTGSTDTATQLAAAARASTDLTGSTDTALQALTATRTVTDLSGSADSATQMATASQTVGDSTGSTDAMTQSSTGPGATYRLWPSTNGPSVSAGDFQPYTMGMQFSVSQDCTLTAVYWWRALLTDQPPTLCGVYDVASQTLLAAMEAFTSPGTSTGWIKTVLASPLPLTAGTAYKVAVFSATELDYSITSLYWTGTGDGASGITTGIITAPNDATAGGQDSFNAGSTAAYPASAFNASNYWIDLEVQTGGGAPVNYTQTVTDGADSTDSVAQLMTATRQFTDQTGSTDTVSQVSAALRVLAEDTGSTDSVAQQSTNFYAQTFTDNAGVADSAAQLSAAVRSQTDPAGSTDSVASGVTVPRTVTDNTGSTDLGQTYEADYAETLTDLTGSTDSVSQQSSSTGGQTFTDNAGSSDSVAQQSVSNYTFTITDSTGATDSTGTALARPVTDLTGSTDTASQVSNQTRTMTDDTGSTDAVNQQSSSAGGQTFTDATGSTDTTGQSASYARGLTDGTGATDSVSQQSSTAGGQTFVDPTGSTDAVAQVVTYRVTVTDTTGSTDTVTQAGSNHYAYTITDDCGSTDQMIQAGKPFPDLDLVCTVEPSRLAVSVESGRLIVSTEAN